MELISTHHNIISHKSTKEASKSITNSTLGKCPLFILCRHNLTNITTMNTETSDRTHLNQTRFFTIMYQKILLVRLFCKFLILVDIFFHTSPLYTEACLFVLSTLLCATSFFTLMACVMREV